MGVRKKEDQKIRKCKLKPIKQREMNKTENKPSDDEVSMTKKRKVGSNERKKSKKEDKPEKTVEREKGDETTMWMMKELLNEKREKESWLKEKMQMMTERETWMKELLDEKKVEESKRKKWEEESKENEKIRNENKRLTTNQKENEDRIQKLECEKKALIGLLTRCVARNGTEIRIMKTKKAWETHTERDQRTEYILSELPRTLYMNKVMCKEEKCKGEAGTGMWVCLDHGSSSKAKQ